MAQFLGHIPNYSIWLFCSFEALTPIFESKQETITSFSEIKEANKKGRPGGD